MKYLMVCLCACCAFLSSNAQNNGDAILGKWESTEKNLIVQVYKDGAIYKGKIVWFIPEDTTIAMDKQLDLKNPDQLLRSRKLIGLDVLTGMVYNAKQDKYVNGKIYDSSSGKTYSATAWLDDANTLNLRGFYLVRMFGKTMFFKRM